MSEVQCIPVPSNVQDLTGKRYGRVVVIGFAGMPRKWRFYWWCLCDCGKVVKKLTHNIKTPVTVSCGCYVMERARAGIALTHGETACSKRTAEYRLWKNMKTRCTNPKGAHWHRYGGRGITLCQEWQESFPAFLSHVGRKPSPEYSLDRIDNDKGYEPGNVRWATRKEQCRNGGHNVVIEYQGESLTLAEWAERLGLNYHTLHHRVRRRGQSFEKAVAEMRTRGPGRGRKSTKSAQLNLF